MSKQKLNNLVLDYQRTHNDETFSKLYVLVSENWRSLETIGKSVRASGAEILEVYEDALMRCIDAYDGRGDFINLLNRSLWRERRGIYRKNKRIYQHEIYITSVENDDGSEVAFEIADEFNIEEYLIAKKKANQWQLIDSLLNGADETTTAIVETFLAHPKPTATAIAKELGYHHSKVIRKLERLAGKFDSKQYGDFTDYLVAL
jgi:DNA-directed RNA polymerase specialized sigma24 family protein